MLVAGDFTSRKIILRRGLHRQSRLRSGRKFIQIILVHLTANTKYWKSLILFQSGLRFFEVSPNFDFIIQVLRSDFGREDVSMVLTTEYGLHTATGTVNTCKNGTGSRHLFTVLRHPYCNGQEGNYCRLLNTSINFSSASIFDGMEREVDTFTVHH